MKILILFCLFFLDVCSLYSNPKIIKGVLNDVSPDEMKVLFTNKSNENETYSDGNLFLYDKNTDKILNIFSVKNLEYDIKSYFLNDDTLLIALSDKIVLYSLKTNKVLKNILFLKEKSFLLSTRKKTSGIYFTVMNYKYSRLSLKMLDYKSLMVKNIRSISVQEFPTDNFFDLYSLDGNIILFNNGRMTDLEHNSDVFNGKELHFDNLLGKYQVASADNTLCCVIPQREGMNLFVVSKGNIKMIPIKIPNDNNQKIVLESSSLYGVIGYLFSSGEKSFFINIDGTYQAVKFPILYASSKTSIIKKETSIFEVE